MPRALQTKFFRKEPTHPQRLIQAKNYRYGAMPRLLWAVRQRTASAGRGPHPAPRLALSFQKTGEIFREKKL